MKMVIQIKEGLPFEHPILEENFLVAFPHLDINSLPPEFAVFERVPCPNTAGVYEVHEVSYQWVDGVVKDVWVTRPMTTEEKQLKIAQALETRPFPSWVFDESACRWSSPTPCPVDGKRYRWDEPTMSWVLIK